MKLIDNLPVLILLCLTLGLAPFYPEPHIWGKLRWIAGGANGMKLIDWWDTLMHGTPFILLLIHLGIRVKNTMTKKEQPAKKG